MLRELFIKNYALIDELTVAFSDHLTVLSGETGAGKSIIVGALGLILGDKARTSSIRSGTESCTVEGRFEIEPGHPSRHFMKERGIEDGGTLIIRRILSRAGISKCFINGLQVNVRDLQQLTGMLIDIHGQHQHQSLLMVKNHLSLLDRYGKLERDVHRYQGHYRAMNEIRRRIDELTMDEREKERRIDILRHSVKEIEDAALRAGEDEELENEYRVLKNYEQIVSAAATTHGLLQSNDSSALSMLEQSIDELTRISSLAPEIAAVLKELESARIIIQESSHGLQGYIDGIEYEPGKIDRLLSRMEQLKTLKKKYGDRVSEIERYRQQCEEELDALESNEEAIAELEGQLNTELKKARSAAVELSARRRVAAKTLEESIMRELTFLSMGKAKFNVNISYKEGPKKGQGSAAVVVIEGRSYELMPSGLDQVEFMISTNVGEPLMPLKNIASGGELSRIMLAIKTVLGNVDPIRTFVFDEIDAGIGGTVSWAVGNRLKELSNVKQILCITHQPQIASRGSLNIRVDKVNRDGRVVTAVKRLGGTEKVSEIARMISGKSITDAALKQAHQMISES
jgi:DNA repair protein RecN (Recombination protein N)